ncbi:hypothetical protein SCUCBS95973_005637 [Sporothrix curviconia]|uniref:tRNA(Phe) 7-[(3-amino-3-carboxypropyl)-4-demethylwyosine(37)-N(4)]-methyltransferase n=1 Tax=Sporothrix curviconia TaxID=1260050 RepID=A0ABP0BYY6_9PEZI
MSSNLPPCPARFTTRKAAILELLGRPDDDYTDASPKGAIDEGVRPLIDVINSLEGYVTTSSCAGRVAVFLEGRKGGPSVEDKPAALTEIPVQAPASTTASAGGKGGGGKWLFVSHDPLVRGVAADSTSPPQHSSYSDTDWAAVFGLEKDGGEWAEKSVQDNVEQDEERLVHFKFEPMILHVLTASLEHAQLLLRCASAAGFREAGAVSIVPPPLSPAAKAAAVAAGEDEDDNPSMPIVAVRSMGLALASVVGICRSRQEADEADTAHCVVTPNYLARLARVADERFVVNRTRVERFRVALVEAIEKDKEIAAGVAGTSRKRDENWEDAEARRARKKEEGLRRQAALKQQQQSSEPTGESKGDSKPESLGVLTVSDS